MTGAERVADAERGAGAAAPVALRVEHLPPGERALGIGTGAPRLSWQVPAAPSGWRQQEYEVEIRRPGHPAESVRVASADQVRVPWPFSALASRERAEVRVRVLGGDRSDWSAWSAPREVEAGLLVPADWQARFIAFPGHDSRTDPAPVAVGRVYRSESVTRARLRCTAHGLLQVHLNGRRLGDEELDPGWTSYHHRLRYRTHDVTDLLVPGENTIGVLVGRGWSAGRLGFTGARALYESRLAVLVQIEMLDDAGEMTVAGTDGDWRWRSSDILFDDLYDGESRDLARPRLGRTDDERPVTVLDDMAAPLERLVAPDAPPIRVVERIPAQRTERLDDGTILVDVGRNVVGRLRVRARDTHPGQTVEIRHAEVLQEGRLCTRPLRSALATDTYRCAGAPVEELAPTFTYHGFRYAEVTGLAELAPEDVLAEVLASDLPRTGWFSSSHDLLDRFHENAVASARGNLLDVPTDCPQRDERLGWTADAAVFARAATYLFDCGGLLTSWLADLAADQAPDGTVPLVVPDIFGARVPVAGWGDAAVIVPTVLDEQLDDPALLRRQFDSMVGWLRRIERELDDDGLWRGGFQFGDWLDPAAPAHDPFDGPTDPDVVATVCLVRSADAVAGVAHRLGEVAVAEEASRLAARARAAFARRWVTGAGHVHPDTAAGYALALDAHLVPDALRTAAGDRLADLVRASGFTVRAGFLGSPILPGALDAAGHPDVALRLLLQTAPPSWLFPVTMGATTTWERWDSMLPDGTVNPGEMTSFNHYALAGVIEWLHRRVAGLAPASPGYRRIVVDPLVAPPLTSARAEHATPYGTAAVRWERAAERVHLRVDVPIGCVAEVRVPGLAAPQIVEHGRHAWDVADPSGSSPQRVAPHRVRDLIDDEARWNEVVRRAVAAGLVGDAVDAARRLARSLDRDAADVEMLLDRERPVGRGGAGVEPGAGADGSLRPDSLPTGSLRPHSLPPGSLRPDSSATGVDR